MAPFLKPHREGRHDQVTKKVAVAPVNPAPEELFGQLENGRFLTRGQDRDWLPTFVADLTNQSGDQRRLQYCLSYEYALERRVAVGHFRSSRRSRRVPSLERTDNGKVDPRTKCLDCHMLGL